MLKTSFKSFKKSGQNLAWKDYYEIILKLYSKLVNVEMIEKL